MIETLPILVGITGKRCFSDDATENQRLTDEVGQRLRMTFKSLSAKFPSTPKILLTGGACGADLIAAYQALDCSDDWSVMVILPYDADLFEKDFLLENSNEMPGASALSAALDTPIAKFRKLLAKVTTCPRVHMRVMPPLRNRSGGATSRSQLDVSDPSHDADLRRNHYEQVGQFIAETAMLLIAVMNLYERPNLTVANGSTARVVACRRAGRPDKLGTEVALRSEILRNSWSDLARPPAGFVWLVEPNGPRPWHAFPVGVLSRLVDQSVEDTFGGIDPARKEHTSTCGDLVERAYQWFYSFNLNKKWLLPRPHQPVSVKIVVARHS
ncbi:MAG: hypothetical protein EXR07_19275 [Acetobacteraceae bacterium]|nr:hypothetical protein [Acetobacteraceae bacterium]